MAKPASARFEVLAERYRNEAESCLEMAERTDGATRRELVLAAARWIELAQEAEASNDPGSWEGELRNMWKPTKQAGLWLHAGGIGMSRFYSSAELDHNWRISRPTTGGELHQPTNV
jgi:hypothetical protein